MPTLTGDGIILQHKQYFYQLNCDQNTCSWEILEEELSEPAIRLSGRPVELLQLKRKLYYDTGRLQARSAKHTTAESERERGPLADRGLVRFTEPRSRD